MENLVVKPTIETHQMNAACPTRCTIIIDKNLPIGLSVNAAAVIALTVGQRHPVLVGEPLVDASGFAHPGLIPIGIAVLAASQDELGDIRRRGLEAECDVVDFPIEGQKTKSYQTFREAIATIKPEEIKYLGIALTGSKKVIGKIVGELELLK